MLSPWMPRGQGPPSHTDAIHSRPPRPALRSAHRSGPVRLDLGRKVGKAWVVEGNRQERESHASLAPAKVASARYHPGVRPRATRDGGQRGRALMRKREALREGAGSLAEGLRNYGCRSVSASRTCRQEGRLRIRLLTEPYFRSTPHPPTHGIGQPTAVNHRKGDRSSGHAHPRVCLETRAPMRREPALRPGGDGAIAAAPLPAFGAAWSSSMTIQLRPSEPGVEGDLASFMRRHGCRAEVAEDGSVIVSCPTTSTRSRRAWSSGSTSSSAGLHASARVDLIE